MFILRKENRLRKRNYGAKQRTTLSIIIIHRPPQTGEYYVSFTGTEQKSNVLRTERLSANIAV